jgi:predicted Fe-Mo cluster-binding NifX family protein
MKIAFPLLNEVELAEDFAHSHYVGIYDDVKNHIDLISLSEIEKHLTIQTFFDALSALGLIKVVSPFYSYMSLRVFRENKIETLKAMGTKLDENIQLLHDMELKAYNVSDSLLFGECFNDCNSCSPSCSSN